MKMLVLSRREQEVIVIDGTIRIIVAKIEGNKVRIAIDAPLAVHVAREEILSARSRITAAGRIGVAEDSPGSMPEKVG
jgi:carbon storage regulator CsrA